MNRDSDQYRSDHDDHDRALLDYLLRGYVLGQPVPFPLPPDRSSRGTALRILRHHLFATASDPGRSDR